MARSHLTIATLVTFLAVTAVLQWWQLPAYPKEVWIMLGFFGAGAVFLTSILVRRGWGALLLCVTIGTVLAFLRVAQMTHLSTQESVETYAIGEQMTLHGVIGDEPDRRPLQTKYTVEVDELWSTRASTRPAPARRGGAAQHDVVKVLGRVLVTDYAAWPRHEYGDEVLVSGVLEIPTLIEDFPYDRYLSRYGIYSIMPHVTVETVSPGHGSTRLTAGGYRFFSFLYILKGRFERQIARLFPEPHASFLSGLLTGSRRGIPKELLEDFKATGLTHIIAISGYNITIVISVIGSLLFFLPLRWRLLPSLLAITFFTLFVGASPSVVRAAIMGGLGLLALHMGRKTHALIAILLAAAAMTAWNPKLLWYDAGFQLSFLSVLGLTYLSPFIEPIARFAPDIFGMRDAFTMTIAAQLAAVPLVIFLFGNFSLVAPLVNVLIALLVPAAMLFGFLGVSFSLLSFPFGQIPAYLGWGALELIVRIAHFFAGFSSSVLHIGEVSPLAIGGYYMLLLLICCSLTSRSTQRTIQPLPHFP